MTAEQQQQLDEVSKELFDYVEEVWVIKDLSDKAFKSFAIASPYLNFRDALFHYKKMYKAAADGDNNSFIQQDACVEEHLNRGLKDFAIHLCANFYTKILHRLIETKAQSVSPALLPKLRQIYHDMKNIVIEIRLGGQTLQHFDDHRTVWLPHVIETIKEFHGILDQNRSLKQLYVKFVDDTF